MLREVDDVRREIAERAGARLVHIETPRHRRFGVDEPVLEIRRAHVPDRAERARRDRLPRERERGNAPVIEADHRAHAASRGELGLARHRAGLRDGVRERLLAEHVLARAQRRDRDLGVRCTRARDVDERNVVACDEPPPVGLGGRPPEPLRRGTDLDGVAAAQRGHARHEWRVERARDGAPRLRMRGAHERIAHHADADLAPAIRRHQNPTGR